MTAGGGCMQKPVFITGKCRMGWDFSRRTGRVSAAILTYGKGKRHSLTGKRPLRRRSVIVNTGSKIFHWRTGLFRPYWMRTPHSLLRPSAFEGTGPCARPMRAENRPEQRPASVPAVRRRMGQSPPQRLKGRKCLVSALRQTSQTTLPGQEETPWQDSGRASAGPSPF